MFDDHDGRQASRREQKLATETREALKRLKDGTSAPVYEALLDLLAEQKQPRLKLAIALIDNKITCDSVSFVELMPQVEKVMNERDFHNTRMASMRKKKAYLKGCASEYDKKYGTI